MRTRETDVERNLEIYTRKHHAVWRKKTRKRERYITRADSRRTWARQVRWSVISYENIVFFFFLLLNPVYRESTECQYAVDNYCFQQRRERDIGCPTVEFRSWLSRARKQTRKTSYVTCTCIKNAINAMRESKKIRCSINQGALRTDVPRGLMMHRFKKKQYTDPTLLRSIAHCSRARIFNKRYQ